MNGYTAQDGFSASRLFSQAYSYTYDDLIFLPGFIDFPADAVDLSTRLSRRLPLSLPVAASPMDTVSESAMAAAVASLGGISFLHSNCSPRLQSSLLRSAKATRLPYVSDPVLLSPGDQITSAGDFGDNAFVIVTEDGTSKSKPLGIVSVSDWEGLLLKDDPVSTYMCPAPRSVPASYDFEQAAAFLAGERLAFAPVMTDGGEVVDLISDEIVARISEFPKFGVP